MHQFSKELNRKTQTSIPRKSEMELNIKFIRRAIFVIVIVLMSIQTCTCQSLEDEFANIFPSATPKQNTLENCSLILKELAVQDGNEEIEEGGVLLVKYHLKLSDGLETLLTNKTDNSLLFQPYNYFLVKGTLGKLLLMLKEYFEPMSVYTLGHQVAQKTLSVTEEPHQCLKDAATEDLENIVRYLIHTFAASDAAVEICNQHINVNDNNAGTVRYVCCKRDSNQTPNCENLQEHVSLYLLFKMMSVIAILFVVYSPLFLFRRLCVSDKYLTFTHKPQKQLMLKVLTVDSNSEFAGEGFYRLHNSTSTSFIHLKKELCHLRKRKPHSLNVSKIHLCISHSQLVLTGDSPISLTEFLSEVFLRCKTGTDLSRTRACCRENMFKMTPCCVVPWYRCLKVLLIPLSLILIVIPWILRVWFYYRFEEDVREKLHHKLDLLNIEAAYRGSLVLYFTPVHNLFITMYCVIPATTNIYIALPKRMKQRVRSVVQECFNRMNKTKTTDALCTFFAHMLWPLTEFGIVGALMIPLWLLVLPTELVLFLYRIVPIFNVFAQMAINCMFCAAETLCPKPRTYARKRNSIFGNFLRWTQKVTEDIRVKKDYDNFSRKHKAILTLTLTMSCLTLLSSVVLLLECVTFYIECLVYVVIGIILNGEVSFKFLVLLAFFIWYCYDCCDEVSSNFKTCNKALSNEVQKHSKLETKEVSVSSNNDERPDAFLLNSQHDVNNTEMGRLTTDSKGSLNWDVKYPLAFTDRQSTMYLSKDFILNAASSKYLRIYSPGPVHIAYLCAFVNLLFSTVFLLFVLLLILAIDDTKSTYVLHLTVFSVIGGICPGLARKYFVKSKSDLSLHNEYIAYQRNISNILDDCREIWRVDDIEIGAVHPADDNTLKDSTDVQLAARGVSVENGHYLEQQISDFCTSNPTPITEHSAQGQINAQLITKSVIPKDINMIVVIASTDPQSEENVDIYVRKVGPANDLKDEEVYEME